MQIKKLSMMLLSALSCAALMNGCGSSSKEGTTNLGGAAVVSEGTCIVCHSTTQDPISSTAIVSDYAGSAHNPSNTAGAQGCQGCHGGGAQHNGVGPIPFPDPLASARCKECHTDTINGVAVVKVPAAAVQGLDFVGKCARCHTASGTGGLHAATTADKAPSGSDDCIGCHAVAAPQHGSNLVGDNPDSDGNPGVRAVVGEFSKWSHHVTGVDLQNAHCAACHLEGLVSSTTGKVVVDATKHMADNYVHLRNADTDADIQWDPSATSPNHSGMDTFCMSCHDANGATSTMSAALRGVMVPATGKTASATNPFGDTISNRYDKMQRPAVVDAKDQFDTTNNSHHGVRGARYTGRTRTAGVRQIASPSTFAANSSATLQGTRSTIYDAGNFNALYSPLGTDGTAATGLGDDSTLHCGDCHTVGQWKPGSSDTANGSPTPVAIGAHGSNNEYLLRNTLGTDQRHTQNAFTLSATNVVTYTNPGGAFLVCYNCHSYNRYGSIYVGTGLNVGSGQQPHAGEYDSAGRCNGIGNTIPFGGYTTGKATDGSQFTVRLFGKPGINSPAAPYAGEQNPDFGNIFGIQCLNCHNSGVGNAYGGIHGSYNDTSWNNGTTTITPASLLTAAGITATTRGYYVDGMGNANKVERFLPGLGNVMHVPGTLGGIAGGSVVPTATSGLTYTYTTGGVSNDTNWEQKHWQQTASTVLNLTTGAVTGTATAGAGCYTLGATQASGAAIVTSDVSSGLTGPSVTGAGGAATTILDTWGGCDDHTAGQAKGNHGFVKRIVRPVTY